MSSIVKKKSPEELKELRHAFKNADTDNSGTLERDELIQYFMKHSNEGMTAEDAGRIFDEMDYDKSGSIDYEEFLIAAVDLETITEDCVKDAFDQLKMSKGNTL